MSQQVDAFARLQSENAELRARLAEAEKTIGELRQRPSLPQSMVGPIAAEVCHEPWVAPNAKRFGSVADSQDAENQCHPDRHLLEMVLFHMPGPVSLIRGDNLRLLFINPAYRAIAPFKEMLGRTLDEIWPETGRDFSSICRRVLETGEPYTVVDELNTIRRSPDGPLDRAYFSWSLHRVPLPGTAGWSLLNLAWETTERQQAAENRRTAYDSFRHLVENSPFGVYVVDSDFKLVQVSAGAQKVFSQIRPLIGRDFAEVLRLI